MFQLFCVALIQKFEIFSFKIFVLLWCWFVQYSPISRILLILNRFFRYWYHKFFVVKLFFINLIYKISRTINFFFEYLIHLNFLRIKRPTRFSFILLIKKKIFLQLWRLPRYFNKLFFKQHRFLKYKVFRKFWRLPLYKKIIWHYYFERYIRRIERNYVRPWKHTSTSRKVHRWYIRNILKKSPFFNVSKFWKYSLKIVYGYFFFSFWLPLIWFSSVYRGSLSIFAGIFNYIKFSLSWTVNYLIYLSPKFLKRDLKVILIFYIYIYTYGSLMFGLRYIARYMIYFLTTYYYYYFVGFIVQYVGAFYYLTYSEDCFQLIGVYIWSLISLIHGYFNTLFIDTMQTIFTDYTTVVWADYSQIIFYLKWHTINNFITFTPINYSWIKQMGGEYEYIFRNWVLLSLYNYSQNYIFYFNHTYWEKYTIYFYYYYYCLVYFSFDDFYEVLILFFLSYYSKLFFFKSLFFLCLLVGVSFGVVSWTLSSIFVFLGFCSNYWLVVFHFFQSEIIDVNLCLNIYIFLIFFITIILILLTLFIQFYGKLYYYYYYMQCFFVLFLVSIFIQYFSHYLTPTYLLFDSTQNLLFFNAFFLNFEFNYISCFFSTTTIQIAFFVNLFSIFYMKHEQKFEKFFILLNFFVFSMVFLIHSSNFILLFFFWEGIGVTSYFLINHYDQKLVSLKSALKAFSFNRVSDVSILGALVIFWNETNSFQINELQILNFAQNVTKYNFFFFPTSSINLFLFFITVAAFCKSAQLGLHFWLPDSMEAPAPASALIHSATLVSAGVFLVLKFSYLYHISYLFLQILFFTGVFTSIFGAFVSATQTDLKRLLAYSTISNCGLLFVSIVVSQKDQTLLLFYFHGLTKSLCFLFVGYLIIKFNHIQDIRIISVLTFLDKIILVFFILSTCSLSAWFFTTNSLLKHIIFFSNTSILISYCMFSLLIISTIGSTLYSLRAVFFLLFKHNSGVKSNKIHYWNYKSIIFILSVFFCFVMLNIIFKLPLFEITLFENYYLYFFLSKILFQIVVFISIIYFLAFFSKKTIKLNGKYWMLLGYLFLIFI